MHTMALNRFTTHCYTLVVAVTLRFVAFTNAHLRAYCRNQIRLSKEQGLIGYTGLTDAETEALKAYYDKTGDGTIQ